MFRNMFRKQFPKVQDAWILAHAIVDTIREPLIVLDQDLRVVAASRSFYLTFKVNADETQGKLLYDLGDGQWDIPKLRFPSIGRRTMILNARKVFCRWKLDWDDLAIVAWKKGGVVACGPCSTAL